MPQNVFHCLRTADSGASQAASKVALALAVEDAEGESEWEDLKGLCADLGRSKFYAHVRSLRIAATPLLWHEEEPPLNVVGKDARTTSITYLPSPHHYAGWLAGRLGVDITASVKDAAPVDPVRVRAIILGGSAMSADMYARYPTDFARATLVVVDPPFGLDSSPA